MHPDVETEKQFVWKQCMLAVMYSKLNIYKIRQVSPPPPHPYPRPIFLLFADETNLL